MSTVIEAGQGELAARERQHHALQAARMCVREWAKVQPGEQTLILTEMGDYADPQVITIFLQAIDEAGAAAVTMSCPVFNPRTAEPPPPVAKALQASDVVFFFSRNAALLHSKAGA